MMPTDRAVCLTLQLLALVTPLLLGGRHPWAVPLATPVVLGLLAVTIRERRRRGANDPLPTVAALAAFVALALLTVVPLPLETLARLAPATAQLYAEMLPGWPEVAEWSRWRTLALDPWAVLVEIGRFSIGLSVFAVVVAYPWRNLAFDEAPVTPVLGRLLLTMIGGGAALAALAVAEDMAGNGYVLWLTDASTQRGRVSGPFVNPNHLAVSLEMVIPVALAFCFALASRLKRRVHSAAHTARGMGVGARRAWMAAIIANQRRVGPSLLAAAAVALMLVGHRATGSRGGTAALLIGLAVTAFGIAVSTESRDEHLGRRRRAAAALALLLLAGGIGTIGMWANLEADELATEALDVSLASRLAVSAQGSGILVEHPLVGTGLGSWLHAFRRHQAPPIEGGIWDHAHNDYLELAAETGILGVALVLLFGFAVARAARERPSIDPADPQPASEHRRHHRPPAFDLPEWRAALRERSVLRWGLVGGGAAALVHALVEFGLRMPANLLTMMLLLALLVVSSARRLEVQPDRAMSDAVDPPRLPASGRVRGPGWSPALLALLCLLVAASLPRLANTALVTIGASPLAADDCLRAADRLMAEPDDDARGRAVALARRAVDRSPADRDVHVALAILLGPGSESESALRRALALAPSSVELRDQLALRQLARGERVAGERELEEAMFQFPYLVSHAYLSPESESAPRDPAALIHALAEGDTMRVRLRALDDGMAAAIDRGLARALVAHSAGPVRTGILDDLVMLREVRGRFAEAADTLRAEAERGMDGRVFLARAASDYLKANDPSAAERTLLAALGRTPEAGDLYRKLAVEVYAARGDFDTATTVLDAGERNALDMLPVYRGVTELLARRAAVEAEQAALAWADEGGEP